MSDYKMLINGQLCAARSGATQDVLNPATGQVITKVPLAGKEDIEQALLASRDAFDGGPWRYFTLNQRKDYLLKITQGILGAARELAVIETENTGKPSKETTFMDIPSSGQTFEYFANNLERLLKSKDIPLEAEAQSELLYEPHGVALLIVPFNYPLLIACWKMAQALAAGNTVILKPSSLTPLTALKLAEIVKNAGLPPGVVNIINAPGSSVGPLLCADARVDMISFTGSPEVGQEIMRQAAATSKKLVMELGGKSASLILDDVDLDTAVRGSLTSIFLNQGQMCTAMSRILIDKKIAKDFIARFVEKAKKIKPGLPTDPGTQIGPLISKNQRDKVLAFIEQGKKEGARLVCGGRIPEAPELKNGNFFEPAVFVDVKPEMKIFQQEIFGPVVCLCEFENEEQAITLANNSQFALAACIWSGDPERAGKLAAQLDAGTVWINTYGMFHNEAPYGGFKQSGFGKELGEQGLHEYSRLKHVNRDTSAGKPLVSGWYAL